MTTAIFRYKGSASSGNRGHAGRIGKVGGSSPRGSGIVTNKYGFQEAIINGNDNIDAKLLSKLIELYEPANLQKQEVSRVLGEPIGSPNIYPGMTVAYDSTTNRWVLSPDSYAHDAIREDAGPYNHDEPFEFRQATGFYDPNTNKLYFYDIRDNPANAEYLAESLGMDVRAINRKIGAAIYAAKTNLFSANGVKPSVSYFNEVEGTYDKEWKVKFRYKGSATSGNRGHAGRPGKVGGSAPKSTVKISTVNDPQDWQGKPYSHKVHIRQADGSDSGLPFKQLTTVQAEDDQRWSKYQSRWYKLHYPWEGPAPNKSGVNPPDYIIPKPSEEYQQ